jgi:hemerythrin superfamily protein
MNALELLTQQHAEVDALLGKLEKAKDAGKKQTLFTELADKVAAHATIEEKLFYPAVNSKRTEDMLAEAVEEHLSVKRLIADLLDLDPADSAFDAKISVMKEQLEHHAHEEEEGELFPKVKKMMDGEQLESLGEDMESMFMTLMEGSPRLEVPSETEAAAPI